MRRGENSIVEGGGGSLLKTRLLRCFVSSELVFKGVAYRKLEFGSLWGFFFRFSRRTGHDL